MGRSLVQRRKHLVGLVVSDLHNPFFADVVAGIQEEAARTGYKVLVNSGNRAAAREADAMETLLQLRADGIILGSPVLDDDMIVRASVEVPIVLVGREARGPASAPPAARAGCARGRTRPRRGRRARGAPRRVALPPRLVVRASTAPPREGVRES